MRKRDGFIESLFGILIFLVAALVIVRGVFVHPSVAVNALKTQGYSNVEVKSHDWFMIGFRGCDEKDAAKFTAEAINPVGEKVEVIVCTGILKGATIRSK